VARGVQMMQKQADVQIEAGIDYKHSAISAVLVTMAATGGCVAALLAFVVHFYVAQSLRQSCVCGRIFSRQSGVCVCFRGRQVRHCIKHVALTSTNSNVKLYPCGSSVSCASRCSTHVFQAVARPPWRSVETTWRPWPSYRCSLCRLHALERYHDTYSPALAGQRLPPSKVGHLCSEHDAIPCPE
jgi:hypothetical protein